MAGSGRITGRVSDDGTAYELWQNGSCRQSIPIAEAHANAKLRSSIKRNGWESLP